MVKIRSITSVESEVLFLKTRGSRERTTRKEGMSCSDIYKIFTISCCACDSIVELLGSAHPKREIILAFLQLRAI